MGCFETKKRACLGDASSSMCHSKILIDNIITVITVIFVPIDQQGEFSFVTNSTELFSNVINKFYERCPDYKSKNCIFLHAGNIMDQNLTMKNYNYKVGNRIVVLVVNE